MSVEEDIRNMFVKILKFHGLTWVDDHVRELNRTWERLVPHEAFLRQVDVSTLDEGQLMLDLLPNEERGKLMEGRRLLSEDAERERLARLTAEKGKSITTESVVMAETFGAGSSYLPPVPEPSIVNDPAASVRVSTEYNPDHPKIREIGFSLPSVTHAPSIPPTPSLTGGKLLLLCIPEDEEITNFAN